jgi:hypothetical protein
MDIDIMRTRIRQDLRDPSGDRWDDDTLNRHIERAVRECSLAAPLEASAALVSTGTRDLSLEPLAARVTIEAVEWPAGQYPPAYVAFTMWGETLTVETASAPPDGDDVVVRYGALHTLDGDGTTLPERLQDLVATGAAAYAAIEWAAYAVDRLNTGGDDTWRHFHTWGQERLASFAKGLAKHGRERRLRSRRLYAAATPAPAGARPIEG